MVLEEKELGQVTVNLENKPSYQQPVKAIIYQHKILISFGWPIEYNTSELLRVLEKAEPDADFIIDAAGRNLGAPASIKVSEVKRVLEDLLNAVR